MLFLDIKAYLCGMKTWFHKLEVTADMPEKFTNPFYYEPHPLCLEAAKEVQTYIAGRADWHDELSRGKMFGVLVVETGEGKTGFLAAYSGLLDGRNDHDFFVPPVFDSQQPDGHFKTTEVRISALNRRIEELLASDGYAGAKSEAERVRSDAMREEEAFRLLMKRKKAGRDARRQSDTAISDDEAMRMENESRFMKAELRRLRKRNGAAIEAAMQAVGAAEKEISELKMQRRRMSDELQRWLFSRYSVLNGRGEKRDLLSIFAGTACGTPPSGAGDCCAPKLLQHAYLNNMRPVCMAEFWWGASPRGEIRRHGAFYPACRGKCLPILGFMLQGICVDDTRPGGMVTEPLEIVYEDRRLAVVCKPAGMPSVDGLHGRDSVQSLMAARTGRGECPMLVHRLDMDTSGLLVVAKDIAAYKALQRQFLDRTIEKRYVALLDGAPDVPCSGTISLPLRPDPLDRPYQKVDFERGKPAVSEYKTIGVEGGKMRVVLVPHTGRTHQLRVHCAHACGLGTPILGDRLYGTPGTRLFLHAEAIAFTHPETGRRMAFERKADF